MIALPEPQSILAYFLGDLASCVERVVRRAIEIMLSTVVPAASTRELTPACGALHSMAYNSTEDRAEADRGRSSVTVGPGTPVMERRKCRRSIPAAPQRHREVMA